MARTMEIIFNGFKETVPQGSTIADLLEHFQEPDSHVIVELNGRFIFAQQYGQTVVSAGMSWSSSTPASAAEKL